MRPPLTRPEKYERLAFTFCRMGTVGLIAWLVAPAVFVSSSRSPRSCSTPGRSRLGVVVDQVLPAPADADHRVLGRRGRALDAYWLFVLGQRLPTSANASRNV